MALGLIKYKTVVSQSLLYSNNDKRYDCVSCMTSGSSLGVSRQARKKKDISRLLTTV